MGLQCDGCNSNVTRTNPGITCSGSCKSSYHYNCIDLPKAEKLMLQNSNNLSWICTACKNTSVRSTSTEPTLSDVMRAISELKNSVEFCSKKIDDFEQKLNGFSEKIKLIEPLQSQCNAIQLKVDDFEQRSRMNNVEIVGVPEKQNENLLNLITKQLSNIIQYPIVEQDIDTIHRVASFDHNTTRPKNIIVRFVSQLKKENFLASARKNKNLTANNLNFAEANKIFLNDHLSPKNKLILRQVRESARDNSFKYVWVRQCKIFTRKNDNSPIIIINSERDIKKIK